MVLALRWSCSYTFQNSTFNHNAAKTCFQHCWSESGRSLKQLRDFISETHAATNNGKRLTVICPGVDKGRMAEK